MIIQTREPTEREVNAFLILAVVAGVGAVAAVILFPVLAKFLAIGVGLWLVSVIVRAIITLVGYYRRSR